MNKMTTMLALAAVVLAGVAQAETMRAITVEQNASYALDLDSLTKSNGKTAFVVQTIYTNKMKAPNGAEYTKATNTFLADCKAKTQALTGVTLMEGSGNPFLLEMIKTNARKLLAYYRARYHYAGAIAQSAREHREIARLIVARDASGAEALMQRHVQFDQITAMDLLAALS